MDPTFTHLSHQRSLSLLVVIRRKKKSEGKDKAKNDVKQKKQMDTKFEYKK